MGFTLDTVRYLLLKPIYAIIFGLLVTSSRIISALGVSNARVTTIRIGAVRMIAPEAGAKVMERAINRLMSEDSELYQRLASGPKFIIMAGSDRNSFPFRYGYLILNMSYFYSIEGLISLLVFCVFFSENSPRWRMSDQVVRERMAHAREQTAAWLQAKGFPAAAVQWVEADGIGRNTNPPRTSRSKR